MPSEPPTITAQGPYRCRSIALVLWPPHLHRGCCSCRQFDEFDGCAVGVVDEQHPYPGDISGRHDLDIRVVLLKLFMGGVHVSDAERDIGVAQVRSVGDGGDGAEVHQLHHDGADQTTDHAAALRSAARDHVQAAAIESHVEHDVHAEHAGVEAHGGVHVGYAYTHVREILD